MYSKLLILIAALMCANASNEAGIEQTSSGEFKVETFGAEDNFLKIADEIDVTSQAHWSVRIFSAIHGQQLVAQLSDVALPVGTDRIRLTFSSGSTGPGRVTEVVAYINIPDVNSMRRSKVYTKQLDRRTEGDIVLNSGISEPGTFSWYVFAIL